MTRAGNALGWYKGKIEGAFNHFSKVFPEVLQDPTKMSAAKFILAVTSNGKTVSQNSEETFDMYDVFRRTGRMPEDMGTGKEKKAINDALKLWNDKTAEMGTENFIKFLSTDYSVRELNKMGFNIAGESADTILPGSVVLGPKIGGAFYQNLIGNFNTLTMDRWWMKTWGRLTGTITHTPDEGLTSERESRLKAALRGKSLKKYGITDTTLGKLTSEQLLDIADQIHAIDQRSNYKIKGPDGKRPELHLAAQRLSEGARPLLDQPGGGPHRTFMRETVAKAVSMLNDLGVGADTADFQALVWYPEKEFWQKYGRVNERAEPTDYEIEFKKLAEKRLGRSLIDQAFQDQGPGVPTGKGS
jgi:hypothetical protein